MKKKKRGIQKAGHHCWRPDVITQMQMADLRGKRAGMIEGIINYSIKGKIKNELQKMDA